MRKIVVDTSVLIDFSRAKTGPYPKLFELFKEGVCELCLPTVVISELWAGRSMSRKSVLSETIKMISMIERVELNEKIAMTAGELLRKKQVLGFDAIVAATALTLGAEVATQNEKHFKNVKELKIFNLKRDQEVI